MPHNRYQIFSQEDSYYQLVQSCCFWQEALTFASLQQAQSKKNVYIFDASANSNTEDVFQVDAMGNPISNGHLSNALYQTVKLTPTAMLSLMGVVEALDCDNAVMVVMPLVQAYDGVKGLCGEEQITASLESEILASPFSRLYHEENDIALMVYCDDRLIATAVFSRYIEDHRFPIHHGELCYELSLHTVYVDPAFRQMGIAKSLANTIVNIARKDMKHLHLCLLEANIRLMPWFSALALTPGGEAICGFLSEEFVDMNDDVVEELMDDGWAISYQEPMIFVESMV
ncbi:GNAT family N-acetyltransferase [uncultured Photobacterium sp.]|uniref:GNAT family N-acetyltransferase n=1 Tax=uncultured Photobacterium sp. TaxID=173973 RepID=UPI00262A4DAF|nr:GNAT family N-acetyltransferase [uncultured Photobacterium sp.]